MSNHLAIATVTATLGKVILSGVESILGTTPNVTLVKPVSGGPLPEEGINVYLYQVTPNAAINNSDLRTRRPKGDLIRKMQIGLDLNYLVTFYGDEQILQPQLLMGSTIQTLVDYPFLTPAIFRKTVLDPTFDFLANSTLVDQVDRVRLVPVPMTSEEISRIWSVFVQSQATYTPSLIYQATIVLIEGEEMGDVAIPVRDRRTYVGYGQPTIDRVIQTGKPQHSMITAKSNLSIIGRDLHGRDTLVRIGKAVMKPHSLSETQINLNLAAMTSEDLRAGAQSLQVLHDPPSDRHQDPERIREPDFTIESNAVAFLLCPAIVGEMQTEVSTRFSTLQDEFITLSEDDPRYGQVTVETDLTIGSEQRVLLILNKLLTPHDHGKMTSYIFQSVSRESSTKTALFPIERVKPGEYLVRIQIDGAESEFLVDENPKSPMFDQFIGPKITIA